MKRCITRPFKEIAERKLSVLYLCTTPFSVWYKPLAIFTVRHVIAGDPLITILTTLRANARDASTTSEVKLNPRVFDTTPCAPRPSVPPHAPLMQPGVSWRTVVVVVRGSGDELVRKTAVFDAKWNITTT